MSTGQEAAVRLSQSEPLPAAADFSLQVLVQP